MNRIETRSWTMELRSIGEPAGHFAGYASVFGVLDSYGTIFDKGSFKKTIKERKGRFPLTWFHDPTEPVGLAQVAEDDRGLLVEGDLDIAGNDIAQRVYSGLRFGYVTEMSHGFHVLRHTEDEDGIEHFTEVKLVEIALLTSNYAANPDAVVTAVREANSRLARMRQLERDGAMEELLRVGREVAEIIEGLQLRGATSYADLPLASREREWDASAAIQRVRDWAGADDAPNAKYRSAFLWFDGDEPDLFGSYKLPFADVIDGKLHCIPRGIFAAAARIDQTDIPATDSDAVKRHLARYYAKMRKEWDDDELYPPWERSSGIEVAMRDLHDTIVALRTLLTPGQPTSGPTAPPVLGSVPDSLHTLLDNLRAYGQELAGRR